MDDRASSPSRRAVLAGVVGSAAIARTGRAAPPHAGAKPALRQLNERPYCAEPAAPQLDPDITPTAAHFVRNNGRVPQRAVEHTLEGWTLRVDGEVERPLQLTMKELRDLPRHEAALVVECGGNGRAGFRPGAKGTQWTLGAVGCAHYAGVRLVDVLERARPRSNAVYVAYYGEDVPLSGDASTVPISRGCPIDKALDGHTMLAFEMNGEPLPALHGFPLRLVVPGHPGSASGKWLTRLRVRERVHDGPKMGGQSYRVPRHPVLPGTAVADRDMVIIEEMPVKSMMTSPPTGTRVPVGAVVEVRGHAWSGHGLVEAVDLSTDFGTTWQATALVDAVNPFAWQRFSANLRFPEPGHYEVWARATDRSGRMQPMVVPGWNPKGYLNNAMHRISLTVAP